MRHILETGEARVCHEQPFGCMETKAFIISTEAVAHPDDLRADDLGVWVNNAVRKSYYSVHYNDNQHRVTFMKKLGSCPPQVSRSSVHCLKRSYYKHKSSKDFSRIIFELTGIAII